MDGAVEMGDCLRGRPAELGLSVGAEGSVLAMTDMPESTGAAEAAVVSMAVEVAADRGECSLVELVQSMPTTGVGLPVPVTGGVPGSGTEADLELAASKARLQLLEGEAVGQWLEQQVSLGVGGNRLLTGWMWTWV
jgi:hypothetical protein